MPSQHASHLQELVAVHERHAGGHGAGEFGQQLDNAEVFRQERVGCQTGRAEQPTLAADSDFQADEKLVFTPRGGKFRREDHVQAGLGAGVLAVGQHRR